MTQNSTSTAQQWPEHAHKTPQQQEQPKSKTTSQPTKKHNCDILLNSFLIKKRQFRVLLNYDHIVWDRLDAKPRGQSKKSEHKSEKECVIGTVPLSQRAAYGTASKVIHIDDIVTVTKSDSKTATESASIQTALPTANFLNIYYALRVIKSATDCNRWRVRSISLYNADSYIVQQWHTALVHMLSCQQRVQRLLVFINPYGGRQQGLQTYERRCKPLFQLAGIDVSCLITQRANQIRDILMSHDLTPFDAVCCVGGDGTVAEVINGLLFRSLRDAGMDSRRPEFIPKPALPVGIIPAGSTDTVAYSLHGTADVRTAAIHLILGQRRGLDICSVHNTEGILRFCASVLSYGYLGDVAAKSEKYRWMGTKRYEYTGVKAFLMNRGYEAEIRILLPNAAEAQQQLNVQSSAQQPADTLCFANCQRCDAAAIGQNKFNDDNQAVIINDQHQNAEDVENPTSSNVSLQPSLNPIKILPQSDNVTNNFNSIYNERNDDKSTSDELDNFKPSNNSEKCDKTIVIDRQFNQKNCTTMKMGDDEQQQLRVDKDNETSESLKSEQSIAVSDKTVQINASIDSIEYNNMCQETENMHWQSIKGSFFMISGANITCACSRSPNGISRYGHLGDGHLDLILVRKTSLLNNVRFLINTMGRNGDIRNLPFVEVYRTRKFTFRTMGPNLIEDESSVRGSCQPIALTHSTDKNNDEDNVSRWNCDGEVVNDLDITMSSHCQLIDFFMRGPHPYCQNAKTKQDSSLCCCRANR